MCIITLFNLDFIFISEAYFIVIMSEEVSSTSDSGPRPIQIVKINDESEEHSFYLDEDALNDILNKDDIRDKPLCIISVAGICPILMF